MSDNIGSFLDWVAAWSSEWELVDRGRITVEWWQQRQGASNMYCVRKSVSETELYVRSSEEFMQNFEVVDQL
jgi:hypothetical protein